MILDKIVASTKIRVEKEKLAMPLEAIKAAMLPVNNREGQSPFEAALSKPGINFICEVKKASPSKGLISQDFKYVETAKEYEAAGAAAISVLTEPDYFLGKNEYLSEIKKAVNIPVLRKDFVIDEYQIYQAKFLNADAVLLIVSILSLDKIKEFMNFSASLGMSALVEAHDEKEVEIALKAGAKIIGVNNRDLKTFNVDLDNSIRLRKLVPQEVLFVSESGISNREDVKVLKENNVNAVLVGETLMKSGNILAKLKELKG